MAKAINTAEKLSSSKFNSHRKSLLEVIKTNCVARNYCEVLLDDEPREVSSSMVDTFAEAQVFTGRQFKLIASNMFHKYITYESAKASEGDKKDATKTRAMWNTMHCLVFLVWTDGKFWVICKFKKKGMFVFDPVDEDDTLTLHHITMANKMYRFLHPVDGTAAVRSKDTLQSLVIKQRITVSKAGTNSTWASALYIANHLMKQQAFSHGLKPILNNNAIRLMVLLELLRTTTHGKRLFLILFYCINSLIMHD